MLHRVRQFFEQNGFGVCSFISKFFGLRLKNLRLFFIYLSLFTIIIGPLIYLLIAFFLKIKNIFCYKKPSVFDI